MLLSLVFAVFSRLRDTGAWSLTLDVSLSDYWPSVDERLLVGGKQRFRLCVIKGVDHR